MTSAAQPTGKDPAKLWEPDPMRQRMATYTMEDVLNLPPHAPRVELLDGLAVQIPTPTRGHEDLVGHLERWLRAHVSQDYKVKAGAGLAIRADYTIEPDILVYYALGAGDENRHYISAKHVVLAVEVSSPRTLHRDQVTRPAHYAAADIRYYWRINQDPVHVYAYQLSFNHRTYLHRQELVNDSATLLELSEPFAITLPIAEIAPPRP